MKCARLAVEPGLARVGAVEPSSVISALLARRAKTLHDFKIANQGAPAFAVALPIVGTVEALAQEFRVVGRVDFSDTAKLKVVENVEGVFCDASFPRTTRGGGFVIYRAFEVGDLDRLAHFGNPFVFGGWVFRGVYQPQTQPKKMIIAKMASIPIASPRTCSIVTRRDSNRLCALRSAIVPLRGVPFSILMLFIFLSPSEVFSNYASSISYSRGIRQVGILGPGRRFGGGRVESCGILGIVIRGKV